jgi:cytochrome P450 family 135
MAAAAIDRSTLPPGPTGPSALVAMRFLLSGPRFLEQCRERYGNVFTITLNTGRTVVIAGDPAIAKEVFQGNPDDLHAGAGNVVLKPILGGRSVLLLDGPQHLRQRRLMLPPFHGERMRAYGEAMTEVAERHVSSWPVGSPFPVHPTMQAITLEIILRTVFGVDKPGRIAQLGEPLKRLLNSTDSPWRLVSLQLTSSADARPRSPWGRIYGLMRPADEMIYDEIRAHRTGAGGVELEERTDILSLLMSARDEDGNALTDEELRDELMTLLLAGHETTATALAWTLERLVRHPEVLARLREEQEAGSHEYLDAVVKETLRLRPVVPGVIRQLQRPLTIGGIDLPKGVHIAPSIYLIHRRPDVYPDPDAFRPERFLGEDVPSTYEWLPFGGGIRRCLGASFAQYEMRIVLSTILRRATLETTAEQSEKVRRRFVTFTPGRGGRIRLTQLAPAAPAPAQAPVAA